MDIKLPCGVFNTRYDIDGAIFRTKEHWIWLIFCIGFFICCPLFLTKTFLSILDFIFITIICVLGINVVTGYCGQLNIGQSAFMAVGAFFSGWLAKEFGLSFWFVLPLGTLAGGLVGGLFGLPSLRVKGLYLALFTLAAQFIIMWSFRHIPFFGGAYGLKLKEVTLGSWDLSGSRGFYPVILISTMIAIYCSQNLSRTRVGRAFVAIRDNDLAAETLGINVKAYKTLAFFISGLYAGFAGTLWAYLIQFVGAEQFTLLDSVWYLGMAIVGGLGSTLGVILGVFFMKIFEQLTVSWICPILVENFPNVAGETFAGFSLIVYGLVIIVFLIFEPRGLVHRWGILKASYRLHPFSY